jgi:hypothetical protein
MDIKSFFTSIDHQILYDLVAKRVKNEEILWLTRTIIFHDCAHDVPPKIQSQPSLFEKLPKDKSLFTVQHGKGLPIGNLTSQFFANVYMNQLDQFVKHTLKAKYYLRYVDDFLIIDGDKNKLKEFQSIISQFTKVNLTLTVHPDKQFIRAVDSGIDFVGYVVKSDHVLVRKRVVGNWRWSLKKSSDAEEIQQTHNAYCAHAIWANTFWLREKMAKIAIV